MACRADDTTNDYYWYIPREYYGENTCAPIKCVVGGIGLETAGFNPNTDRFSTAVTTTHPMARSYAWVGTIPTNPLHTDLDNVECLNIEVGTTDNGNHALTQVHFEVIFQIYDLRPNPNNSTDGMALSEQTLAVRPSGSAIQPGEYGHTDYE
jgi:hypothetical protein